MKVAIEENGGVIWYRDSETQEGMASLGYLKDGTQQKIIAALEEALFRAKGQLQISDSHDAPRAKTISASISIDTSEAQSQLDDLISLLELKFGSLQPVPKRINQNSLPWRTTSSLLISLPQEAQDSTLSMVCGSALNMNCSLPQSGQESLILNFSDINLSFRCV